MAAPFAKPEKLMQNAKPQLLRYLLSGCSCSGRVLLSPSISHGPPQPPLAGHVDGTRFGLLCSMGWTAGLCGESIVCLLTPDAKIKQIMRNCSSDLTLTESWCLSYLST